MPATRSNESEVLDHNQRLIVELQPPIFQFRVPAPVVIGLEVFQ
jgi:hypothetical protein